MGNSVNDFSHSRVEFSRKRLEEAVRGELFIDEVTIDYPVFSIGETISLLYGFAKGMALIPEDEINESSRVYNKMLLGIVANAIAHLESNSQSGSMAS